jgi:hypothetical protein
VDSIDAFSPTEDVLELRDIVTPLPADEAAFEARIQLEETGATDFQLVVDGTVVALFSNTSFGGLDAFALYESGNLVITA